MNWIAGWNKRIKLTISGSCIEGDLSNFPVLVHLNSTCSGVFNELGSNSKRISVVDSNQQQCYVEIETWDESTNNAWLWTKVPTLSSGVDSDLYLYYDNLRPDNSAYVGTVGETPAQNVWDDNFVGVWHMGQDPSGGSGCIKDSTSNANNGTPGGSMTSGDLVDGKVGKALDFDGSNDYLEIADSSELDFGTGDFTLETIIKTSDNVSRLFYKGYHTYAEGYYRVYFRSTDPYVRVTVDNNVIYIQTDSQPTDYSDNVYHHIVGQRDGDYLRVFGDGSEKGTAIAGADNIDVTNDDPLYFGTTRDDADFSILISDENRISNIARSTSWIKATYHSNWNTLINYGDEEIVSLENFLPGWNNRLKLTIQNEYVDNTLTDFPILIKLSDSSGFNSYDTRSVFYELEDNINRKKIAITDSTGVLQCFVEIERFSCAETEAVLWVRLPVIYDSVGTHFYLYYDKTKPDNNAFVGDVNSIVAQNVWDSNFVGVWHMNQNPTGGAGCIKDSTFNVNHGTPGGSMTSGDLVDGKIGKALDFDGGDDYITVPVKPTLNSFTVSQWVKLDRLGVTTVICDNDWWGVTSDLLIFFSSSNYFNTGVRNGGTNTLITSPSSYTSGVWYYVSAVADGTNLILYIDGTSVASDSANIGVVSTNNLVFCKRQSWNGYYLYGQVDDIHISNIARSASWIKATYHSNWDSLIIYEKEVSPGWLGDWAKRIPLTIDHSKIDNSLIGFPILITLASGVQSDFFSELDYPSVDDDFTGTNGSAPDSDLWGSLIQAEIQGNKLRISSSAVDSGQAKSIYKLTGDFDVQVDFDSITAPTTNSWATSLRVTRDNGHLFQIIIRYESNLAYSCQYYNGSWYAINTTTTSDTTGKFRIVRTGSTCECFYYNSGWQSLGTHNIVGTDDVLIDLRQDRWSGNPVTVGDFDNFKLNYGTVIWPQDTHPNRKKIALTINNGTTQCPIEIEQWDFINGKVNLWTKIPTVVFDSDTTLYLYYDSSKDDNSDYVGDIGSASAKNVWDDNFVGVWHMGQDPSGGANCIKDSTSNANHGTPGGSMTSGDLVDGKIGKALDFDGSDDFIDCGTSDDFDFVSSFTLECSIYPISGVIETILCKGDRDGTNINYRFLINNNNFKFECWDGSDWYNINDLGISYTDSAWQYVGLSYNGSNMVVYKDIESYSNSYAHPLTVDNYPLYIAARKRIIDTNSFNGNIDEVRISNIPRTSSWIKATYYSNWDTLLTYGSVQNYTPPPDYYYHGYVKEKGTYVERKVYLYRRDTGALIDSCTSNSSTGYYLLETSVSGEHFIVALDDDAGDTYNALVEDRLYPNDM